MKTETYLKLVQKAATKTESLIVSHFDNADLSPSPELIEAVELLVISLGEAFPADETHAELIETATNISMAILNRQAEHGSWHWTGSIGGIAGSFWTNCQEIKRIVDELLDTRPKPPAPERPRLESLKELEALPNMSDRSIAQTVGWRTPAGEPDAKMVDRARRGVIEWPQYPVGSEDGEPARPQPLPHAGILEYVADMLKNQRAEQVKTP